MYSLHRDRRRRHAPPESAKVSVLLQFARGAGEDFDEAGFRLGIVVEPLAHRLAQMIEGGLNERR